MPGTVWLRQLLPPWSFQSDFADRYILPDPINQSKTAAAGEQGIGNKRLGKQITGRADSRGANSGEALCSFPELIMSLTRPEMLSMVLFRGCAGWTTDA